MKHKKKKIFIAIAITLIVATAAFLFFACQSHESGYAPPPDDVHTVTAPPPTDGSTPEDYEGIDNLAFMAGRLAAREYYHSENTGLVDTIANQTVVGSKDYYNGILITQSISMSAFVNVAEQKFFGDGKVVVRGPASGKGDWDGINTKWSDGDPVAVYDEAQYEQAYGLWASEFSDYVMNEETVIETGELNVLGGGMYSQTFTLDPNTATYYYKHQMMTMGGLGDYPLFSSVVCTFTFDDTWAVHRVDIVEEYEVYAFFMTVGCTATSSIVYSYDLNDVNVSAYDEYFCKYADASVTGGGDKELGVTDYLQQGFAEYLARPSTFDLALDIGGSRIDGAVTLDISGGINVRALIGGIYLNVTDENIYLSYKDFCGFIPLSYITENMGMGGVLDLDGILGVLGAGTIDKQGEKVTISCALNMGGTDIPLVFGFTENESGISLDGISVTLKTDIGTISASLTPSDAENIAQKDISSAVDIRPMVDNIVSLIGGKSFGITLDYSSVDLSVKGDVYINAASLGVEADLTITAEGVTVPVSVVFDGSSVYLRIYNVGVKASVGEIEDAVKALLAQFDFESNNLTADISSVVSALAGGYNDIIKTLAFDENGLALILDGEKLLACLGAEFSGIGDVKAYYDVAENTFALEVAGVKAELKGAEARTVEVEDEESYIGLSVLEKYIGAAADIIEKRDVRFDITFTSVVDGAKISGDITGEIKFANGIEVYLKLTVGGKSVEIYYSGGTVYFGLAKHVFRITESELNAFIGRIGALAEEFGLDVDTAALLESFDLNALLESIRISGAESDGAAVLKIFADLGTVNVGMSEIAATFECDGKTLHANLDAPFAFGELTLDEMSVSVSAAENEYVFDVSGAVDVMPYLDGICGLLEERSAQVSVSYSDASFALSGRVYLNGKTMSAEGDITLTFDGVRVPINAVYSDGTVYLKVYNVCVKADKEYIAYALEQVLAYTGTELPDAASVKAGELIASLLNSDLSLIVTAVNVTEDKAEITVDGGAFAELLGTDIGELILVYVPAENTFTLEAAGVKAELKGAAARTVEVDNEESYVELSVLEKYVGAVADIIEKQDVVFTAEFDTVLLGVDMHVSAQGEVVYQGSTISLYVKLNVLADGYADDSIEVLYADGYITVLYCGKALRVSEKDISSLIGAISGMTDNGGSAALALFGDGGIDINALLESLRFALREQDGHTVEEVFIDLGIISPSLPALGVQLTCDGSTVTAAVSGTELFGLTVNGLTVGVRAGANELTLDLTDAVYCGNVVDFVLNAYVGLADSPYMQAEVNYVSDLIEARVSGLFAFKATETAALDIDFDITAEIHTYVYDGSGVRTADGSHYLHMTVIGENAYITYSLYGLDASGALNVYLPVSQLFEIGDMVLPLLGINESASYYTLVDRILSTDYTYFSTGIFDAVQFADVLGLLDGITFGGSDNGESSVTATLGMTENGEKKLTVNGIAAGDGTLDIGITAKAAGEIVYDTGKSYIDISSISLLLGDLLSSYDYIDTGYALSGTVNLKIFGITLDDLKVEIDLRVGVDEKGMPYLNVRLTANQYDNALAIGFFGTWCVINGNTVTDITYKDGNIYMTKMRTSKWEVNKGLFGKPSEVLGGKFVSITPEYEYRRMTLSEFGADAMNQMFFAIGLSDGAKNYIAGQVEGTEPANKGSDAGDMVNGYSFDGNVYNLKLNLGAIIDNDALGELDINIHRQMYEGRDYYDLVRLQGSVKLVSIITATFDITHDSVGEYVDLSMIDENIARVNANV